MSLSEKMAINFVPLLLRLGLGVVFMWTGWSKFSFRPEYQMEVSGADAALLANAGLIAAPGAAPELELQDEGDEATDDAAPEEATDDDAAPEQSTDDDAEVPPEEPARDEGEDADTPQDSPAIAMTAGPVVLRAQAVESDPTFAAADFPDPVLIPRRQGVALLMLKASHPEEGRARLWPEALTSKRMLILLPWAEATIEFVGGFFLIFGFLTRLSALGLVASIGAAMLVTTIGPAIVSGDNFLWFLPPMHLGSADWKQAWTPWLFQFLLLIMSASLVVTGAGKLSADRRLFGRSARRNATADDDDQE